MLERMSAWVWRGAAFAFGVWTVYLLATSPWTVIKPAIAVAVGFGVLLLCERISSKAA